MRYILDQTVWHDNGHYIIGLRDEKVLAVTCGDKRGAESRARVYSAAYDLLHAAEKVIARWEKGQVDIPGFERSLHLIDAYLVRRERVRVHLRMHRVFLLAQHLDLRNAAGHGNSLRDARLRQLFHSG